jgi:hypothetical protein
MHDGVFFCKSSAVCVFYCVVVCSAVLMVYSCVRVLLFVCSTVWLCVLMHDGVFLCKSSAVCVFYCMVVCSAVLVCSVVFWCVLLFVGV